ncbi:MAG: hypothetical protein ABI488_18250 [Polyangiaceae bacterium]
MRSLWPLLVLGLAACVVSGCHSALDDALDSYADARYPTAAAQFRALGRSSRELSPPDFASYALYRGLTHLALGDARAAARWLGYAKQCADRDPTVFNDEESGALRAAWRSMGHMPGEPGFATPLPDSHATAATAVR